MRPKTAAAVACLHALLHFLFEVNQTTPKIITSSSYPLFSYNKLFNLNLKLQTKLPNTFMQEYFT